MVFRSAHQTVLAETDSYRKGSDVDGQKSALLKFRAAQNPLDEHCPLCVTRDQVFLQSPTARIPSP